MENDMRRLLMIFAKVPEHGKVKTRLAETIGDDKALQVYLKLLQHTHEVASRLEVDKLVFYASSPEEFDLLDYYRVPKTTQNGDDLGERMKDAFKRAFAQHYNQVVIIGSDCYDLSTEILEEAFKKLGEYDLVIGPAEDGGYYLLGMNEKSDSLFEGKKWSTQDVFLDTILDIKGLERTYHILPTLKDVDRETDLSSDLREKANL
ncbi:MAG: glycosyltransferase [Flavobacteriales bacterium]|nr:glycosyltransferase [Flavobacteriales bacterium]